MADSKISALPASATPLAGTEILPIVQSSTTKQVSVANLTAGRAISVTTLTTTAANAMASTGGGTGSGYSYITNTGGQLYFGVTSSTGTGLGAGLNNYSSALTTFNATDLGLGTNGVNRLNIGSTGGVTVVSGNLVIGTSGKGIDFSADSHATGMTSELLDDYEEGTFTPTWIPANGSGANVNVANGYYTKVGNLVTIFFRLGTNGHGTSSGNITIGGLPFASSYSVNNQGSLVCGLAANMAITAGESLVGQLNTGATTVNPVLWKATTGTQTITAAEWGVSGVVFFTGSYQAA
jgi:hypothetical protein